MIERPPSDATSRDPRHDPSGGRRPLAIALVLLVAFLVFEVVAALAAHSLALLADAGHMLADVGAIAASLVAIRLAARPPSGAHTYGLKRAEILSATGNGVTLLVVAVLVTIEAIRRLVDPAPVHGLSLVVVAGIGVAVNLAATTALARADRRSLNVEGAFRHVLTDLYGFAGTIAAGIVVAATGFRRADPVASLVVVALMLRAAVDLLRPSVRILLEGAPEDLDLDEVRRHILELPEVLAVHDLHAWTLTSSLPILTAHVVVTDDGTTLADAGQLLDHLQACLRGHFDVAHSTFQLEVAGHVDHEHPEHP